MSAANGGNDTNGRDDTNAVRAARPVALVRRRPDRADPRPAGRAADAAHLVTLPAGDAEVLTTGCGLLLLPGRFEAVPSAHATPCPTCVLRTAGAARDTVVSAAAGYRGWEWPVDVLGDQVWLDVRGPVAAIVAPLGLATAATALLDRWRCRPAVLTHPGLPGHRVLLAGERFAVPLPCPAGTHRAGPTVPLPPTRTPDGALSWAYPPTSDTLRLCREIDVLGALRAAGGPAARSRAGES